MENDIQVKIIAEFEALMNWDEKYEKIIDIGKSLERLGEKYRIEANKVNGCQSRVWLHVEKLDSGLLHFEADSDSLLVRGLVGLMIQIYNDHTPEEILTIEPYFIEKLGFKQHLSPTRSNGLFAVYKKIKSYALALSYKDSTI